MKRLTILLAFLLLATRSFAEVSVSAAVDRAHVGFGDNVTFTITVKDSQDITLPTMPDVDGLKFNGPSTSRSMSWINGQTSQSLSIVYEVQASRQGEFTIPALSFNIGGKVYRTQPIKLTVDKPGTQTEFQDRLYGKVQMPSQRVYLGQVAPVNVLVFARQDVPTRGPGSLDVQAEGLGYKYSQSLKSAAQVINGENFNIYVIEGVISPTQAGVVNFGPIVVKVQIATNRRSQFEQMMYGPEIRELPVTIEALPIEVLPMPSEGRPPGFKGAIGQWDLEVTAKPTEVSVGDPITVVVKVKGTGNIDTVPPIKLSGLDGFKTYDPTSKTTNNELGTQGERDFQQVLIAKDTTVSNVPAISLVYFDPVAGAYKTASHEPIPLKIKAGAGGRIAVLTGSQRAQPSEDLGQDLVYLKGDLGPAPGGMLCGTAAFWVLNLLPLLGLTGALVWKRRIDRLTGDVAYARRCRAARQARQILAEGNDTAHIQRALQEYLGDRLNIPSSGITASVVDERLAPRGVNGTVASEVRRIFEVCDATRFSGTQTEAVSLQQAVERVIDELEKNNL